MCKPFFPIVKKLSVFLMVKYENYLSNVTIVRLLLTEQSNPVKFLSHSLLEL